MDNLQLIMNTIEVVLKNTKPASPAFFIGFRRLNQLLKNVKATTH